MKVIFSLRYLFMLLALPALLGSCDIGPTEPQKPLKVQHEIQVRVRGANLTGLGAQLHVKSTLNFINGPYVAGAGLHKAYTTSIDETYELGTFGREDIIEATIFFANVTKTSLVQPAATTKLKLELIANGVIKENTELNKSATGWKVRYDPHLTGSADLKTTDL